MESSLASPALTPRRKKPTHVHFSLPSDDFLDGEPRFRSFEGADATAIGRNPEELLNSEKISDRSSRKPQQRKQQNEKEQRQDQEVEEADRHESRTYIHPRYANEKVNGKYEQFLTASGYHSSSEDESEGDRKTPKYLRYNVDEMGEKQEKQKKREREMFDRYNTLDAYGDEFTFGDPLSVDSFDRRINSPLNDNSTRTDPIARSRVEDPHPAISMGGSSGSDSGQARWRSHSYSEDSQDWYGNGPIQTPDHSDSGSVELNEDVWNPEMTQKLGPESHVSEGENIVSPESKSHLKDQPLQKSHMAQPQRQLQPRSKPLTQAQQNRPTKQTEKQPQGQSMEKEQSCRDENANTKRQDEAENRRRLIPRLSRLNNRKKNPKKKPNNISSAQSEIRTLQKKPNNTPAQTEVKTKKESTKSDSETSSNVETASQTATKAGWLRSESHIQEQGTAQEHIRHQESPTGDIAVPGQQFQGETPRSTKPNQPNSSGEDLHGSDSNSAEGNADNEIGIEVELDTYEKQVKTDTKPQHPFSKTFGDGFNMVFRLPKIQKHKPKLRSDTDNCPRPSQRFFSAFHKTKYDGSGEDNTTHGLQHYEDKKDRSSTDSRVSRNSLGSQMEKLSFIRPKDLKTGSKHSSSGTHSQEYDISPYNQTRKRISVPASLDIMLPDDLQRREAFSNQPSQVHEGSKKSIQEVTKLRLDEPIPYGYST